MHPRLVRTDATTLAVTLTAGPGSAREISDLLGCGTLAVVRLAQPGPGSPVRTCGWLTASPRQAGPEPGGRGNRRVPVRQPGSRGLLRRGAVTGGPGHHGQVRPLSKDYDDIITTITGQLRSHPPGHQPGGTTSPEVR